jgi:hypothetical protein
MAGFFRALTGAKSQDVAGTKPLPAELKRITHSSFLSSAADVPADALASVAQASQNESDRREIMKHLSECMAESSGKHWRRVYGGLVLLEDLLKSGSPELVNETAEGHHFDLVQRLSFLAAYNISDKTAQGMVRTKAGVLRKDLLPLLEAAALRDKELASSVAMETASTCSPGSTISGDQSVSGVSTVGFGPDDLPDVQKDAEQTPKKMVLNNIVTVGHSDDTTSESECGDGSVQAVRFGKPTRMSTRARDERSSQGKGNVSDEAQEPKKAMAVAAPVDLLDF